MEHAAKMLHMLGLWETLNDNAGSIGRQPAIGDRKRRYLRGDLVQHMLVVDQRGIIRRDHAAVELAGANRRMKIGGVVEGLFLAGPGTQRIADLGKQRRTRRWNTRNNAEPPALAGIVGNRVGVDDATNQIGIPLLPHLIVSGADVILFGKQARTSHSASLYRYKNLRITRICEQVAFYSRSFALFADQL